MRFRKVCDYLQTEIDIEIEKLNLDKKGYDLSGIKGYITDTKRGRAKCRYWTGGGPEIDCNFLDGEFSVPLWAYDKRLPGKDQHRYFTYYVAHELAHILRWKVFGYDPANPHDDMFYDIFTDICPKHLQQFELGYKKSSHKFGVGNEL